MKKTTASIAVAAVLALMTLIVPQASAGEPEKVTLCHAAGQTGTTQFTTITISYSAAYGTAGHFNEDGTPQAGHEDDYLGPCVQIEATTTTTVGNSTTTSPGETTTTVGNSTTTSPEETTTPSTTSSVPTLVLPAVEEMPGPDPVATTPSFTG